MYNGKRPIGAAKGKQTPWPRADPPPRPHRPLLCNKHYMKTIRKLWVLFLCSGQMAVKNVPGAPSEGACRQKPRAKGPRSSVQKIGRAPHDPSASVLEVSRPPPAIKSPTSLVKKALYYVDGACVSQCDHNTVGRAVHKEKKKEKGS